jgi:putative PIN family toxin of toxin-antitoxin system
VDRWLAGAEIEVVICPELLHEISEALTPRKRLRTWIFHGRATTIIEMIGTMVDLVSDPPVEDVGTRDIEDAYLVSLARMHNCDFIVTGDKDVLSGCARSRDASLQLRSWIGGESGADRIDPDAAGISPAPSVGPLRQVDRFRDRRSE